MQPSLLVWLAASATLIPLSEVSASPFHDRIMHHLKLERLEPYSRARAALARQGWKPFKTGGDHGEAEEVAEAGWNEVAFCSGTGLSFCRFVWKSGGQCVLVTTAGEYIPARGAPKVWDVELDSCPKILRRI